MGKVKGLLEDDMMRNPELYNNHVDYEFWIQCRKEKLLEKEGMDSKSHKLERKEKCKNINKVT